MGFYSVTPGSNEYIIGNPLFPKATINLENGKQFTIVANDISSANKYIESVWYLLKELYNKDLIYKGYSIQPYSPAAGSGLSTHELNQPGCYRDVKDTACVAQFKVINDEHSAPLFEATDTEVYILAWTTTPWTLPSNTALTVGAKIEYSLVRTFNPYTGIPVSVLVATQLMGQYFPEKNAELPLEE